MALLLPVCSNCKKMNCLKGESITTAWKGLRVIQTRDVRSVNTPDWNPQNFPCIVERYSTDAFTTSCNSPAGGARKYTGRLLVKFNTQFKTQCNTRLRINFDPLTLFLGHFLFSSLDGWVYDCD